MFFFFFLNFMLNEMQNSDIQWMATKADTGLGIEHRRKQNIVCKWDRIMDRQTDGEEQTLQLLDAPCRPFRSGP